VVPAVDILLLDAGINAVGRRLYPDGTYEVTRGSIRRNLRGRWVIDDDPFQVNQIGHPYQGALYHAAGRSAGLNYWQSAAYTFAGSAMWELAGETTKPSLNDQVASGIAGSFLGEGLFRMANLLIDKSGGSIGPGRGLLVLLLSPPTSFNRIVYGDRFDGVMPTREPAYDMRANFGVTSLSGAVLHPTLSVRRREGQVNLFMEYGLPINPAYRYSRPFDYFALQATASSAGLESVTSLGLLAGRRYDAGEGGGGIWGLYGSFDYIAPVVFRVSTTAASFGTTLHTWLSPHVAMQATALAGVGFAAAQTARATDDRGFRYGLAPQAVAAMRVIASDRVSFDLVARPFFVSSVAGFEGGGRDVILIGDASISLRMFARNAVTLRYEVSRRETSFTGFDTATQERRTLGLFYTLLGPQRFGAMRGR